MSDYQLEIGELVYQPIPETWRDVPSAVDEGSGRPRLFAVSVAVEVELRELVIRYAHPDDERVVPINCGAHFDADENTVCPAAFEADYGTWPRSVVAPRGVDPDDVLRQPELEHFDTLWGERLGLTRAGRRAVADGGGGDA